jgi:C_GCAxxG_C_C family probable redox protein
MVGSLVPEVLIMQTDMDRGELSDRVVGYMKGYGCNCAEAMLKVMAERLEYDPAWSRLGTVFGSGISGNADLCGLLSGGLIVISLRFGRVDCENKDQKRKAYEIGSEFYRWFMREHGRCTDIKGDPKVGPWDECHKVARETVAFLADLIDRHR